MGSRIEAGYDLVRLWEELLSLPSPSLPWHPEERMWIREKRRLKHGRKKMSGLRVECATGVERNTPWLSVSAAPSALLSICQVRRRARQSQHSRTAAPFAPSTQHLENPGSLGTVTGEQQQMAAMLQRPMCSWMVRPPVTQSSSLLYANKCDLLKGCKRHTCGKSSVLILIFNLVL